MPNFHPILVHFTIALFVTSVTFDLIGYITGRETLKAVGRWNLILAGISAIPTVITGLIAESTLPHTDEAHRLMDIHKVLGIIVLGILISLVIWRLIRDTSIGKMVLVYLIIGIVGLAVMTVGAYYGGEMVYTHGMGVAPIMAQMDAGHDNAGHDHGESETVNAQEHHEELSSKTMYTCPMHAEIISSDPGNCSKCGMALKRNSQNNESDEETMHKMGNDKKDKDDDHSEHDH